MHSTNLLSQPGLPASTAQSLCSGAVAPNPGFLMGSFTTLQMSGLYLWEFWFNWPEVGF